MNKILEKYRNESSCELDNFYPISYFEPGNKFKLIKEFTIPEILYKQNEVILPRGLVVSVVSVHFTREYIKMKFVVIRNKIIKDLYYDNIPEKYYLQKFSYDCLYDTSTSISSMRFTLENDLLVKFLTKDNIDYFTNEYEYFTKHKTHDSHD